MITILTKENIQAYGILQVLTMDNDWIEVTTTDKVVVRRGYYKNGLLEFAFDGQLYRTNVHSPKVIPTGDTPVAPKVAPKPYTPSENVKHKEYELIKTCIRTDIPVYLVGEAGTGKNFTLQAIAEELQMEFYFTNSVQQEYKITGFIDAGGVYHETEFYKAFTHGGLFFLDELDASIPEVLVLLNAAIANRYFEFPNGKVTAHPDFRVVAAGNTSGSGANDMYTGRMVLDSATLDRFVEIKFDYDRNIELALAKGNKDLVNFTRSLREFCKKNGIRATFSYRMIMNVVKLEAAGIPLKEIIKIAVVKGLDADTVNMLKVELSGQYYYALREVQVAC